MMLRVVMLAWRCGSVRPQGHLQTVPSHPYRPSPPLGWSLVGGLPQVNASTATRIARSWRGL
jgi:hypothetical protein